MIVALVCWEKDRLCRIPSMVVLAAVHQPGLHVAQQAVRMVSAELPIHGGCRG